MELFKDAKPTLRRNFPQVYDGTADLYVYFFARTHQILRPGGTACFISSNKWMKAGYGEPLRRFFAESAWVESVVDFGHAKQIFQDADVFPSILVFRKPTAEAPPLTARVCAIPREQLRLDDLSGQVEADGFEVPRDRLGADAWTLEPPGVMSPAGEDPPRRRTAEGVRRQCPDLPGIEDRLQRGLPSGYSDEGAACRERTRSQKGCSSHISAGKTSIAGRPNGLVSG